MSKQHAIYGVDCGRSWVKIAYVRRNKIATYSFESIKAPGKKLNIAERRTGYIECFYKGQHYFIGKMAYMQSLEYSRNMAEFKDHEDTLLFTLVALAMAGAYGDIHVVTGVPVKHYNAEDGEYRKRIRKLLKGEHHIIVNDEEYYFNIKKAQVTFEGGGVFWSLPEKKRKGMVRIIDAGSKTVNYVSVLDDEFIDPQSDTIDFGADVVDDFNPRSFVETIIGEVDRKKWRRNDLVFVSGGKAEELLPLVREWYPRAELPKLPEDAEPKFANAVGYLMMGAWKLGVKI